MIDLDVIGFVLEQARSGWFGLVILFGIPLFSCLAHLLAKTDLGYSGFDDQEVMGLNRHKKFKGKPEHLKRRKKMS